MQEYIVEMDGKSAKCTITKRNIKKMYLTVRYGEVDLKIPLEATFEDGIKLIEKKKNWIFSSLAKMDVHGDRRIDLERKNYIYILDNKIDVEYEYGNFDAIAVDLSFEQCKIYVPSNYEEIYGDMNTVYKKAQSILEQKEKKMAKKIIDEAMQKYIRITGLKPVRYGIGKFKSIWGNCNSKHEIKINQNVIWYSKSEIEYVCLHELCHLRYMNHQKRFWSLVEKYMPDYKKSIEHFKE